ncbi:polysaccharide deacetylase family protein [Streptomyces sp. MI02-7b]|nr:polysaccharide deacetylase family protein [Streptomyces sp. MI02-7b]
MNHGYLRPLRGRVRCRRNLLLGAALGALVLTTVVTGCAKDSGAAAGQGVRAPASGPDAAGSPMSGSLPPLSPSPSAPAVDAWAKWGLKPLAPAPGPPAVKPVRLTAHGPVPVISDVPTKEKIVFITIDDGQEKSPAFVRMLKDLKVPVTMFLTNDAIKSDYGYFTQLQGLGNHIQNHTLHHPEMNRLSPARQRAEICGNQEILAQRYGSAPLLFRPPYGAGAYGDSLNAAVRQCGPGAIVLWRESMQIKQMQYQTADKRLRPGDIILAHFRGPAELKGVTMTHMFANMLRHIREQGFTVARLEDYIQAPPAGQ